STVATNDLRRVAYRVARHYLGTSAAWLDAHARLTDTSHINAYAGYVNTTWHVTSRFELEACLSFRHDSQHYSQSGYGLLITGLPPPPEVLIDNHSADSTTTFSFSPKFHINDKTMLYARVASGFLPGGPNVVPAIVAPNVPKTFTPTQLTDYELGLKSTSLDQRLMVDLSAYYIDWTKIPLTTYQYNFTFLSNAGAAQSKGLEATIRFIPARGLTLSANASYSDPTLTKNAPPPSNGKVGDRLPYAPKFTLGLNGDYDFALGGGWHGFVGAGYTYISERSSDFTTTPGVPSPTIPGYNTINLRAGVNDDQWSIDAYVKNVTNQRGIVLLGGAALNPITDNTESDITLITPRLFGISVSRNF
ncbi:MAG: TonB-dependent receptor, partial [Rhodanobacteraceae bacterium]